MTKLQTVKSILIKEILLSPKKNFMNFRCLAKQFSTMTRKGKKYIAKSHQLEKQ